MTTSGDCGEEVKSRLVVARIAVTDLTKMWKHQPVTKAV